jgi:hypothetical protein
LLLQQSFPLSFDRGAYAISKNQRVLGDPQILQTAPGAGYKLVVE